ncbi:MAG: 3-dehydroquinate synthase [Bacteroidales bacterium]|nr:3-dehydroquinate synthase [Bacteroidales bacterium]
MNLPENVVCTKNADQELKNILDQHKGKVFVLADEHTEALCLPLLPSLAEKGAIVVRIQSGEENKNLNTLQQIWMQMGDNGGDRKSLFVNLGGGVIGDMGGLAASLFKRGIRFVNVPTTLLAQVDASCGGKLAVDFNNLKNEIGLFRNPDKVIISPEFLKSLPMEQIVSGMAEMIKHAVLYSEEYLDQISEFDPKKPDYDLLASLVETSVRIKNDFAGKDPTEKGIRKMLNLGHTIGHAVESYSFTTSTPLLHGEAVAIGIVSELFLSNKILHFPVQKMMRITNLIASTYKPYKIKYETYDELIALMTHDKKNTDGMINFSLMSDYGQFQIDQHCTKDDIYQSLSFYNQMNL